MKNTLLKNETTSHRLQTKYLQNSYLIDYIQICKKALKINNKETNNPNEVYIKYLNRYLTKEIRWQISIWKDVNMCPPSWTPSHLPPHPIPQGCPSAPALSALSHASDLDWRSISHMVIYIFQYYSLKSSHPRLLLQSPKVCSLHLCLFCCPACRIIIWRWLARDTQEISNIIKPWNDGTVIINKVLKV